MVEVETYNNRINLFPTDKDVETTRLRLSDKDMETKSKIEEVVKQSNGGLKPMRKIRRTKSAGIF